MIGSFLCCRYGQNSSNTSECLRVSNRSRGSRGPGGSSSSEAAARRLMEALWPHFERDFASDSSSASASLDLSEVIVKLKKWKDLLTRRTQLLQGATATPLEEVSYSLCDLFLRVNVRLEVPGQLWKALSTSAAFGGGGGGGALGGSDGGVWAGASSDVNIVPSGQSQSSMKSQQQQAGGSKASPTSGEVLGGARGGGASAGASGGGARTKTAGGESGGDEDRASASSFFSTYHHHYQPGSLHASSQTVFIEGFSSETSTATRSHYTLKRLGFVGSNGNTYYFVVQPYSSQHQRSEQRMLQLLMLINHFLFK